MSSRMELIDEVVYMTVNKKLQRYAGAICLFALLVLITHVQADVPAQERLALEALYANSSGYGWLNDKNWLGDPGTECQWFGINCDDQETTVLEIDLTANNLIPG